MGSTDLMYDWIAESGPIGATSSNTDNITVTGDNDAKSISIALLEATAGDVVVITAGLKLYGTDLDVAIFTGGPTPMCMTGITNGNCARLDVDNGMYDDAKFEPSQLMNGGAGDNEGVTTVQTRTNISHSVWEVNATTPTWEFSLNHFVPSSTVSAAGWFYSSFIQIFVQKAVSACPHDRKNIGPSAVSMMYQWTPKKRCKRVCKFCEKKQKEYDETQRDEKKEKKQEKQKERQTMEEVMLYLLQRTKKADEKEERTSVKENQKEERQDPDRAVLDGLVKLPKQHQPKAMLIMACCTCSCGKFECDICGCHELSGCEGGMRIPRPEASALELRMFWNTVLSNLNDDGALRDLAKRQGAYRSIRAFLSLDQNLGKEK